MNKTTDDTKSLYPIEDYYIVASLSSGFGFLAIIICTIILVLIWRTKLRLHAVHYLLMCNTCIASIFYSAITINNYIFFIFIQSETSDVGCRWRAYFAYIGIAGVLHSYMIQAISRFFFCVLSTKYRWLITFKTHYILIAIQWIVVLLITSSTLITKDIRFQPGKLCFIPIANTLHVVCGIFAYYVIPLLITIIIYIYIYSQVKQTTRRVTTLNNTHNSSKRDLEVFRNIVILISIYIGGGLPSILFFLTPAKYPYLINLVTQSLAVAVATLCTILLDREIRGVIKSIVWQKTAIMPFKNTFTAGRIQLNLQTTKRTNGHHLRTNAESHF